MIRRHKLGKVMPNDFVTSETGESFRGPVYPDVVSLEIVNVNGVLGVLKQLAIALFAFTQGHLRLFAFGDTLFKFRHIALTLFEQLCVLNRACRTCGQQSRRTRACSG